MSLNVKKYESNGFQILRKLFTSCEFDEIRALVFKSLDEQKKSGAQTTDLLADHNLEHLIYDDRLLNIARKILGNENICYFGDSNYAVIGKNYDIETATGWHRDNTDRRVTDDAPDWKSPYTLIRFGFYLQDHSNKSGGLMVRKGSHNNEKANSTIGSLLQEKYLNTSMGDVGVWNMRISHSGVGKCLSLFPSQALSPYTVEKIPNFLVAKDSEGARSALWISYGLDDAHLKRHCDYLLTRSERKAMWENAHYSDDTLAKCEATGLKVINLPEKIRQRLKDDENAIFHDHHYQMDY